MDFKDFMESDFFKERVEEISDERDFQAGIFVYPKRGWAYEPDDDHRQAEHVRSFKTEAEAIQGVKDLDRCSCEFCRGLVD